MAPFLRPGVIAGEPLQAPPSTTVGPRVVARPPAMVADTFAQISPSVLNLIVAPVQQPTGEPLPDAGTQKGNLFTDRFTPTLHWYLPEYSLADAPDASFSFSATQKGLDSNGNPFHTAGLKIGVKKVQPQDVVAFKSANAGAQLREIPLHNFAATLIATYTDDSGTAQRKSFPGAIQARDDGSLVLTFDNVMGNNVILLYENLKQGGAQVSISGAYDVWKSKNAPRIIRRSDAPRPLFILPIGRVGPSPARSPGFMGSTVKPVFEPAEPPEDSGSDPPGGDGGTTSDESYEKDTLYFTPPNWSLDNKYTRNDYQLKYTITSDSVTRPIINVHDLKDFDVIQSEFVELLALGDISQKYASLKKLYMGTLSRTIVVVPHEYTIVRKTSNCAAVCLALVDSLSSSSCKFDFEFLLAPKISPIDFLQLGQDVSKNPDCKDCQLKYPDTLSSISPSSILTLFQTSCNFEGAASPHSFNLDVWIRDDRSGSPAVANANLFIKQLSLAQEPYVTGTISLKLDDHYPAPVETNVILNFQETGGTEGVEYTIDVTKQCINLMNVSPFDFQIQRYALITKDRFTVLPLNQALSAGQTLSVPLPQSHDELSVVVEYEPLKKGTVSKREIDKYLQFQTQDVQNTEYLLGVNASGINWKNKGVAKIDVLVALTDLKSINVPTFSLTPQHTITSAPVLIPIQNAISNLDSTLQFTVHYADSKKADQQFSKQNDFIATSIFQLQDAMIPA